MAKISFRVSGSIKENEARYKKITEELSQSVPSSLLSLDDKPCTIKIIDLIEVSYGDNDGESYAAFLAKDEARNYPCQMPVFYPRKVFSGYDTNGSITAGKCRGTFVDNLEDGSYSWETVSKLLGRSIRVHNVVKIIGEKNGKRVTHRVYTLDLIPDEDKE